MSDAHRCPQCGGELPADAPEGLCPECLLIARVETEAGPPSGPEPASATPSPGRFVPPDPAELAPLFPQLEILELLGSGGMGAVYKARQAGLDRLVALKILPHEAGADPAFAERFTREARALAKLAHPHIVTVHDFGQVAGLYYFVMEYVDGVDLRQMLRAGQLQPREALAIVPQVCEALQFAHDEGIVHRDIKPENILVDKRGRVKIADFGLAKLLGTTSSTGVSPVQKPFTLTGTGQVMGTWNYMAPEQLEHPQTVDHRADIYSLGVVFYEMLTGELPIGRFAPPSKKVEVDVRLDEVVLRALEKDLDRRYQHASEVKTDVESISSEIRSTASRARPPAVWDPVFLRRVTKITLIALTLWIVPQIALEWGSLAGAEWYFKKELPYDWLNAAFLMLSIPSVLFGVLWFYLLAKEPGTPLTLQGCFDVWMGSHAEVKRAWRPLLICFGVWLTLVVVVVGYCSLRENYILWPQILVLHGGFVAMPFVFMAVLWRAFRQRTAGTAAATRRRNAAGGPGVSPVHPRGKEPQGRYQHASQVKTDVESIAAAGPPAAPPWALRPGLGAAPRLMPPGTVPQVLAVAIGMVISGLSMAAGVALIGLAFLLDSPGTGSFWGWMGGAFGCIFGGLGGLAGSWNSYRQIEGAGDLMQSPDWTWLDKALAGYTVLGVITFVSGLVVSPWANWPTTYSLTLLGGMIVFQGGLFLVFRALARRAARQRGSGGNGS